MTVATCPGSKPPMLYLPETMKTWPWPRIINPHYEEVSAESSAWFHSFNAFSKRSQYAFDKGDFGRLAALAYAKASKEHLRTGCNLMNIFFLVEEYTDVESPVVVQDMVDIVMDALNNPHKPRPEGEIVLGEATRQFWELAIRTASPNSARHFVESFKDYLDSLVVQAEGRAFDTFLTVNSYLQIRRQNIGARPSYVPGELHLDFPDEVFYHPVVKELESYITDLIILDNDIASYNKEQAAGDDRYNILTIVMHQFNIDLQAAMVVVCDLHHEIEAKFLAALKTVPSFGPEIDEQLQEYIQHLAGWPRSNDCWNFEGGRYFGNKGLEIQKTRCVPLMPKIHIDRSLRRENVVLPLAEL
ncbi:isoprenoid synthase domain-containing protein [Mycena rebaudengoi]|nr:isoprenoid synthase domain-containing protein [Mycena rebaudengoi]